jgi:hypothetical protein
MTQAIKDEELLVELLDDDMDATEYSININIDEGRMRIQFHNEDGLLSTLTTDSYGGYEFAQRLLRAYDRLEGL